MENLVACFIGHRKIDKSNNLENKLAREIEKLINCGVKTFLFGSRSEFDKLCHSIVSNLKEKYPFLVRVKYNTSSETALNCESELNRFEHNLTKFYGEFVPLQLFEKSVVSEKSLKAGRGAYIERNKEIIDASDFCIFYYNKDYLPPTKKHSKHDAFEYQPKSGTAICFEYAKAKHKIILNVFE